VGSRVAARLGIPFLDTGAMYRAITWLALHQGIPVTDAEALTALARSSRVSVSAPPPGSSAHAAICIGGLDATPHLREAAVERSASAVSAVAGVREVMVDLQRQAAGGQIVMAGRDIGTVVLPDADVKVFLVASAEVRARRRVEELQAKGTAPSYDDVLADLRRRDGIDSTRAVAPLRPADDAVEIDTDALTIDEVVARVLALVERS
jgi:cytidylate kinase